jgi:hypothetical protein
MTSTPVSAPVQRQLVAPVSAPVQRQLAAPAQKQVAAPASAPVQRQVTAPAQKQLAAPVLVSAPVQKQAPAQVPVQAPNSVVKNVSFNEVVEQKNMTPEDNTNTNTNIKVNTDNLETEIKKIKLGKLMVPQTTLFFAIVLILIGGGLFYATKPKPKEILTK